jgi:hypothetical protein
MSATTENNALAHEIAIQNGRYDRGIARRFAHRAQIDIAAGHAQAEAVASAMEFYLARTDNNGIVRHFTNRVAARVEAGQPLTEATLAAIVFYMVKVNALLASPEAVAEVEDEEDAE